MRTIATYMAVWVLMALSGGVTAAEARCSGGRCVNDETRGAWGLTFTPSYKNSYEIGLLPEAESCNADKDKVVQLPRLSYFRQTLDRDAQVADEMIVHVYEVDEPVAGVGALNPREYVQNTYFNQPLKLCLNGSLRVSPSRYKRVGGVSTGLLVVPFKLRDGDIYSDAAIGPYISYRWHVIELLATAGISQVSVSEIGSDEVDSRTGLTVAGGINFSIDKNWDVALLVGVDRLSGAVGDQWVYQGKAWFSFAIGFNFTR